MWDYCQDLMLFASMVLFGSFHVLFYILLRLPKTISKLTDIAEEVTGEYSIEKDVGTAVRCYYFHLLCDRGNFPGKF